MAAAPAGTLDFHSAPSTRVPSSMEIYAAFPFRPNDLTIPNKRPPAEVVRKLIRGIERNARFIDSNREGCAEVGHRWLCISPTQWNREQVARQDEAFNTTLEAHNAARDVWIAAAPGTRDAAAWTVSVVVVQGLKSIRANDAV